MIRAPEHLRKLSWYLPHQAWLKQTGFKPTHDPEGAKPKRADLRNSNLRNSNLSNSDLRGSNLRGSVGIYPLDMSDPRGYRPVAVATLEGWRVYSGCRSFSIKEALDHWGSKNYQDKEIGKRYVRAIKALQKCPKVMKAGER